MQRTRFCKPLAVLAFTACVTLTTIVHASTADTDYYKIVTEKNLFRKLGWSPPTPGPQFQLVMVVGPYQDPNAAVEAQSPADAAAEANFWAAAMGVAPAPEIEEPEETVEPRAWRALITRNGGGEAFYVEEGEKVGNMTVAAISSGGVELRGEGEGDNVETETLRLQGFGFGAGGGGGGGRNRGGGDNRPNVAAPSAPSGPPAGFQGGNPQAMFERFRNASPEEREAMRAQFRQGGFGGGRGGGRGGGGRGGD